METRYISCYPPWWFIHLYDTFSIFQYTFIGWVCGGPAAHLYKVYARDSPACPATPHSPPPQPGLSASVIKALQALHDSPPLCLFLLLRLFWHKNINVSIRFDQIHQLFHKILSINIILKSIKGHNSVEKFGKIMRISHNMDHIYQCINKILSKSIHYF